MNAAVIFWHGSADCALATTNAVGGVTYTMFDSVSAMRRHIEDNNINVTRVDTI